jgi:DOPA 4,5-dioxygenase
MFEIDIPAASQELNRIIPWIMVNHKSLTALLHPHSGDELADHTVYPFWIGQPVPLDLTKL